MFYGKHLSKTLQNKLQECLDVDESEQTQLLEELALCRQTVLDVAIMYDEAGALLEACPPEGNTRLAAQALRAECGDSMRRAIKDVADVADRIERHRAARKETDGVSVHALAWVAKQFAELAHKLCGDDLQLARAFEEGARSIRLPDAQALARGTMLTPDSVVLEMDETIPSED